ncbi:hypothetical protein HQ535_15170 [bacterium]|nr:hypothetical protein [bacterium]
MLLQGEDPFSGNELSEMPGAEFSEEDRGDLHYFIITAPVSDVTEIEEALVGTDNSLLENFNITVTDTLISVDGTASAAEAFGEDLDGFDPGLIEDSLSASVKLTLPGKILSHNADSQDGNTLSWAVPLFGGNLTIQAESDPTQDPSGGSSGFPTWLLIVIILAVVAAAGWFFMNRNKAAAAPAAAAEAVETALETEDDVPPPPPAE